MAFKEIGLMVWTRFMRFTTGDSETNKYPSGPLPSRSPPKRERNALTDQLLLWRKTALRGLRQSQSVFQSPTSSKPCINTTTSVKLHWTLHMDTWSQASASK